MGERERAGLVYKAGEILQGQRFERARKFRDEKRETGIDAWRLRSVLFPFYDDAINQMLRSSYDQDAMNILVTPKHPHRVIALLDFEFTQIGHPADDLFCSFDMLDCEKDTY